MKDGEKIPREDSLMLRSSSLLNETTGLWPNTTVLWLEKHKITQNTKTKRERSSEAAIVGAIYNGNVEKGYMKEELMKEINIYVRENDHFYSHRSTVFYQTGYFLINGCFEKLCGKC
ncbi:hypothetical protein AMECASPLE_033041 [Ameca splendens]|uniref:Uncharacterized protein n=1 Tax=Ameca splendens TaxID=208324 RepID=A0ABV1ADS4_9TELE